MRQAVTVAGALVLAGAALVTWQAGLITQLQLDIVAAQRAFQAPLAAGVRALKAQQPGAVAALIWLGFLYGVLHAAGPGHGKVVLGGWAFSARARLIKVAVLTLAASLAQSLAAIVLVLAGAWAFGLGRSELTGLAEGPLLRAGEWALVALGVFLMLRGTWHLWREIRAPRPDQDSGLARRHERSQEHGHEHWHEQAHSHDAACGCGHAHGPAPEVAARASLPEAVMLVAGVALRPCTGAVFVMLLTVLIGAPLAGAAAVLAMGLGTAMVTLAVALLSARLGTRLLSDGRGRALRRWADAAQIALGLLIVALYL
ncbi:nickel/cobalt transporter [Phaeovulum sp. W22_SRMD_FR3]|uniref:nickel/cobalt transporter n=1 Tax=Phaeovulum sp. W22_SRMD_FR3 TaxID=3240274 RepID=UPI003F9DB88C